MINLLLKKKSRYLSCIEVNSNFVKSKIIKISGKTRDYEFELHDESCFTEYPQD